jgi:3-oxoacyl-[acyl-carrier-protein] synthase III
MTEYHYPKFEDWFDELEKFSFRSERFHESMAMYGNVDTKQIIIWLQAAFDCGRMKKGEDE